MICYLPVVLPILREKVLQHYPDRLEKYDELLRLIKPYWHFHEYENRQGFVKLVFDIAKFFGYKLHTYNSGCKLDINGYDKYYSGICHCCNKRVYGNIQLD